MDESIQVDSVLGQTISIATDFEYFHGDATWLLIVRDIDDGINTPYLFDFHQGPNFWVAITYGHDYKIIASQLTIVKYRPPYNAYEKFVTNNFCHLQSNGRIHRGTSMTITLSGKLSPNRNLYNCNVSIFPGSDYTIVEPEQS